MTTAINLPVMEPTKPGYSPEAPPAFHLLAKPTGAICNLDCAYCFFLDKEVFYPNSKFRMNDEVVETVSRETVQTKLKIMNLKSTIRLSTLVG